MGEYLPNFDVEGAPLAPIIFADSLHAKKLCSTLSSIGAPHPNFGGSKSAAHDRRSTSNGL